VDGKIVRRQLQRPLAGDAKLSGASLKDIGGSPQGINTRGSGGNGMAHPFVVG
jgi:hypothetical protein